MYRRMQLVYDVVPSRDGMRWVGLGYAAGLVYLPRRMGVGRGGDHTWRWGWRFVCVRYVEFVEQKSRGVYMVRGVNWAGHWARHFAT